PKDHVLHFLESYKPTRYLIQNLMTRYGVTWDLFSVEDHVAVEQAVRDRPPKLVVVETPTNPQLKVVDMEWLGNLAASVGALVVLDGTFGGFHNHRAVRADFIVHSLTKYASGHGDVMGGVILGSH